MCSRYDLNAHPRDFGARFLLPQSIGTVTRGEIRPTDTAPVIDITDGTRAVRPLSWGLTVPWDKTPLINARAETLATKRTFQPLLSRRCLVPATGYFAWRKDGRTRIKTRVAPAAGGLFAFAGLSDGSAFTIVTCASAPEITFVEDRMPVILTTNAEALWLDPECPFDKVAPLLVPFSDGRLETASVPPSPPRQGDLFAG